MKDTKTKMNKIYVAETDPDYGVVYIAAKNLKEAKRIALGTSIADHMYRYIDLRVKWCKSAGRVDYEGELTIDKILEAGLNWFDCPWCNGEDFELVDESTCKCKICNLTFEIPYLP